MGCSALKAGSYNVVQSDYPTVYPRLGAVRESDGTFGVKTRLVPVVFTRPLKVPPERVRLLVRIGLLARAYTGDGNAVFHYFSAMKCAQKLER